MKSMYVIPAHRKIEKQNFMDFFEEVRYINENEECPFVLFDDNDERVNYKQFCDFAKEYPQVGCYYVGRKEIDSMMNMVNSKLDEATRSIFNKLYCNKNVNYGNVFNRIFLFAVLLKCDCIHRRDSDVLLDRDKEGRCIYPIEIEKAYLGKKQKDKIAYIVGGGYKGTYNLDIEGLIRDGEDYTLVKELFLCMSIPEEHHEDIINEEIKGNNVEHSKDIVEVDSRAYPECGNVAIYKLFEFFPLPVQDWILGSDYFFIDVAVHTQLNVVYHNRAVVHKHTKDRKDCYDKIRNYWYGFLLLIDSQVFYRKFYENCLERINFNELLVMKTDIISKELSKEMQEFYVNFFDRFVEERKNMLIKCISILKKSDDAMIKRIANDWGENDLQNIQHVTNQEIINHIEILNYWGAILDIVKCCGESNEGIDFLDKTRLH